MSYEVTATRRRPKTFDEMAGQEFVVATLKSSIESGRIAHAYLFSGPRGCGKTSAARILARSLNCEKGPTATPCGVCNNCVEIARGASMDVIEIDGASNTSVNDVRQIKDEVLFPPHSGRYKVYIIDEVHMLSNSAFNALLKTIEEPPPYIIFIFATTELHKVPATIKSRCQQFAFRLISIDTIKVLLAEACREMNVEAEDEALFWIAKEATGSLRDAYTLFDQVLSFSDGRLRSDLIREKLGLAGLDAVNALAEACAAADPAGALAQVDALLERGISVEQFVIDLAGYYRSLLLIKSGVTREALLGYAGDRFSPLAREAYSALQLERAVSLLLDLYRDIRFSVSPRFELEAAVSRLCWLGKWISPAELKDAVDGVRGCLPGPGNGLPGPPTATALTSRAAPLQALEPVAADEDLDLSRPGALTEGFKRFMAAKGKGEVLPTPPPPPPPPAPAAAPEPVPAKAGVPLPVLSVDEEDTDDTDDEDDFTPPSTIPAVAGDPRQIRQGMIGALKKERGMLASALEKTLDWEFSGGVLTIPVRDRLTAEMLRKEIVALSAVARDQGGAVAEFEIVEKAENGAAGAAPNDKQPVPPEAELVRRMFRGSIVRAQ